ncbi:unnamed protein product [Calypogeia fissa]
MNLSISNVPPLPAAGGSNATSVDTTYYIANCLAMSNILTSAFKAVIELGIPDILAKAEGGKSMSGPEILAKLPTKTTPGPKSVVNINRLLRPLVYQGIFIETLNEENQPAYGLTEISNMCVRNNKASVVPFHHLAFSPEFAKAFDRLHEVILDESQSPFVNAWGMSVYEYVSKHPEFEAVVQKAMNYLTHPELKDLLDKLYHSGWLEGVKTFVDVGGGKGNIVAGVVARNPNIKGINYDLPQVVEGAPQVQGVQHVGGDFYESAPSGDVMFLKYILHNHSDENCMKILTSCSEALSRDGSENGKVVLAEYIRSNSLSLRAKDTFTVTLDAGMMGLYDGGHERTEAEYKQLLAAAGFPKFSVIQSETGMDLIQAMK